MKNAFAVSGWVIAAVALVAVAYFGNRLRVARTELAALQEEAKAVEARVAELSTAVKTATKQVADASEQAVRELETHLVEQPPSPEPVDVAPEDPAAETPADDDPKKKSPLAKMLDSMDVDTMAKIQAVNTLDMSYKRLFDALDLPPDVKVQVHDALLAIKTEENAAMFRQMKSGDETNFDETEREKAERNTRLRASLATLLSKDDLAAWEDYENNITEHTLAGSMDMMVGMYAGALTPENRVLAVDTVVEEMMASLDPENFLAQGKPTTDLDIPGQETHINRQLDALARAQERLADAFDDEQYAAFGDFVEQYGNTMRNSIQMMREMTGELADEVPTETAPPED